MAAGKGKKKAPANKGQAGSQKPPKTKADGGATSKANKQTAVLSDNETAGAPPKKRLRTTVEDVEDEDVTRAKAKDRGHTPIDLSSGTEEADDDGEGDPNEDPEAELARLRKRWGSPIYAFYEPKVKIETFKGRRTHLFTCARPSCSHTVRRYVDKKDRSTGNMRKHALSCWGEEAVKRAMETADDTEARKIVVDSLLTTGRISAYFGRQKKGSITYSHVQHNREETRAEIVKWVSESLRPFSIVRDPGFLTLMKTGRPGYYLPSPSTVSRDTKMVFARSRQRIAKLLQEYDGRISFATDAWTSPNHRAFVAITAHLEHKGKPLRLLLDVVEVAKSHTGIHLAQAFAQVLQEFGIEHKILSVTCDNASNNDTMTDELANLLAEFEGQFARTRCFLHIVNLTAKSLLKEFDVHVHDDVSATADEDERELLQLAQQLAEEEREAREEGDEDEDDELDEDDDDESWLDEVASLSPEERAEFESEVRPVKKVLMKLRRLAFKIIHSTTKILPAWNDILKALKLPPRLMPRDVKTRWNSTFDMLNFAVDYRKAIDTLCASREHGLRAFELSRTDWAIATELRDVLKIFKDATLFFSRDTPNLAMVIPAMDHIDATLTDQTRPGNTLQPPVSAALRLAKKTLNKYYKLSDLSATYRIAMVLHPSHKLRYFENARWPAAWIKSARDMVQDEFDGYYAKKVPESTADEDEEEEDELDATESGDAAGGPSRLPKGANVFDHLPSLAGLMSIQEGDEVARYLSTPPEPTQDALAWWTQRRDAFPRLSRMALDYLSIPATSVDVERTFSRGRRLLSHVRSRLTAQSTRALLCVGDWVKWDLVRSQDIRAVVKLKEVADGEGVGDDYRAENGWDRIGAVLAGEERETV